MNIEPSFYHKGLLLLFFLFISYVSISQSKSSLKGFIIDSETFDDLSGVHVYTQRGVGTVSNKKGFFRLSVNLGDTVFFSRIDYEKKTFIISNTSDLSDNSVIRLKQKVYILDSVDIYSGIPEPTHLYREKHEPVHIPGITKENERGQEDYRTSFGEAVTSPATALYQAFSKKYKEEKEYHEIMAEQEKLDDLKEKAYQRLTDFFETQEVRIDPENYDLLLDHCHVGLKWLTISNDYDIYLRMHKCILSFSEKMDSKN